VRVLVAGGAGYIGSHTCKALAQAGHTPIVYDNLRSGHAWAVKWGPLERMCDYGSLMFSRRDVNICNKKGSPALGFGWRTGRAGPLRRAAQ
jgi:UDP-glucose 4-epimerase